jgi:hypothetical protein
MLELAQKNPEWRRDFELDYGFGSGNVFPGTDIVRNLQCILYTHLVVERDMNKFENISSSNESTFNYF